jgi:hypothetical protein
MDHHCPWIGTCVGLLNHKAFVLFLFYTALALTTGAIVSVLRAVQIARQRRHTTMVEDPAHLSQVATIVGCIVCAPMLFAVLGLLSYHVYLITMNYTTVETALVDRVVGAAERAWLNECRRAGGPAGAGPRPRSVLDNPYCKSTLENWEEVFGPISPLWLLPIVPSSVRRHGGVEYRHGKAFDDAWAEEVDPLYRDALARQRARESAGADVSSDDELESDEIHLEGSSTYGATSRRRMTTKTKTTKKRQGVRTAMMV